MRNQKFWIFIGSPILPSPRLCQIKIFSNDWKIKKQIRLLYFRTLKPRHQYMYLPLFTQLENIRAFYIEYSLQNQITYIYNIYIWLNMKFSLNWYDFRIFYYQSLHKISQSRGTLLPIDCKMDKLKVDKEMKRVEIFFWKITVICLSSLGKLSKHDIL